jgi:outer membrane protein assembly factor BamB
MLSVGLPVSLLQAASTEHPQGHSASRAEAVAGPTSSAGGQWLTYGGSASRLSVQDSSPPMLPLRSRWTAAVDGAIYGEPLIDDGMVFVATENDTVYALAGGSGRVVWERHLGTPVPAGDLPCGDIYPAVGVTSTMVIGPSTGQLFVSGSLLAGGSIHHDLWSLALATGKVQWSRDLDRPGWTASAQLQRTGLALAGGRVIVAFGGNYGDCGQYHGWVMSSPETSTGTLDSYMVPTSREAAVWAPSGVSVAGNGNVFAVTGNGASDTTYDEGDSVLELSPTMHLVDWFAPSDWAALNASDGDLGSSSAVVLPGNRLVIVGKNTVAYLLDEQHLGHIGGQLAAVEACFSQGGDAWASPDLLIACPESGMMALSVGSKSLGAAWRGPSADTGSPTIAGGIAWSLTHSGTGVLYGLAPRSGRVLVEASTVATEHFAAPSAGEGLLVVGGDSHVQAFEGPRGFLG